MINLFEGQLVLDGAMGTELIAKGLRNGEASIEWNIDHPDEVWDVHRSYVLAGSATITTNTFGGNAVMLRRHGLEARMVELNREAAALAKSASMGRVRVLGDIGPCGEFLEPLGDLEPEELVCAVREQAAVLASAGVDGFIVETMSDPAEVTVVVATLKAYFGLPVIASFTYEKGVHGYQTMMGNPPALATKAAIEAGADAVGANCGTSLGLHDYVLIAEQILRAAESVPVVLQPNAGTPDQTADGYQYSVTPEAFGEWAVDVMGRGVKGVGGCCGTTPKHIEAVCSALSRTNS